MRAVVACTALLSVLVSYSTLVHVGLLMSVFYCIYVQSPIRTITGDFMWFRNYHLAFVLPVAHSHGISKVCILLTFFFLPLSPGYDVEALCNINDWVAKRLFFSSHIIHIDWSWRAHLLYVLQALKHICSSFRSSQRCFAAALGYDDLLLPLTSSVITFKHQYSGSYSTAVQRAMSP